MYSQQYEIRQSQTSGSTREYGASESVGAVSTTGTTYRSAMSPRVTNVQRSRASAFGGGGGAGVTTRYYQSYQSSGGGGGGLAALANMSGVPTRGQAGASTALVGFNVTRHRDKRDLVHLNDKFAQYIEKVRFLEAQNKKLQLELDALRNRSGLGSSRIKEMYDVEMVEAHKLIDITKRDAAAANVKTQQAEQDVERQKARLREVTGLRETDRKEIDTLERQIAENQAQINLFRRRIGDLEDESRRYKAESQRLMAEITRLQNEIQNERFLRSSCDVEKVALDDELASLRHMHEVELAELRSASVSTDLDPSHFFRNELALAIQEIRNDFENVVDNQRTDLQSRYSMLYNELIVRQKTDVNPVQGLQQRRQEERFRSELLEVQNQNGYLRAKNQDVRNRIEELQRKLSGVREENGFALSRISKEIADARARWERAEADYREVTSLKTSLEAEIGTYRELLESQTGLRGYVDRIVQGAELVSIERGGAGARTGGLSTTTSRTIVSTSGGGFGGSSLSGASGISTILSTPVRGAATSSFQVGTSSSQLSGGSSASRTVYRESSSRSDSQTRSSGEY